MSGEVFQYPLRAGGWYQQRRHYHDVFRENGTGEKAGLHQDSYGLRLNKSVVVEPSAWRGKIEKPSIRVLTP